MSDETELDRLRTAHRLIDTYKARIATLEAALRECAKGCVISQDEGQRCEAQDAAVAALAGTSPAPDPGILTPEERERVDDVREYIAGTGEESGDRVALLAIVDRIAAESDPVAALKEVRRAEAIVRAALERAAEEADEDMVQSDAIRHAKPLAATEWTAAMGSAGRIGAAIRSLAADPAALAAIVAAARKPTSR